MRKIIVGAQVSMDGVMQAPLVTQGSTELVHALLANDLVDAVILRSIHRAKLNARAGSA